MRDRILATRRLGVLIECLAGAPDGFEREGAVFTRPWLDPVVSANHAAAERPGRRRQRRSHRPRRDHLSPFHAEGLPDPAALSSNRGPARGQRRHAPGRDGRRARHPEDAGAGGRRFGQRPGGDPPFLDREGAHCRNNAVHGPLHDHLSPGGGRPAATGFPGRVLRRTAHPFRVHGGTIAFTRAHATDCPRCSCRSLRVSVVATRGSVLWP